MFKSRKYKTGSKWAFWRWTITPSEYITRLHIIMTPWFAICLHWINKPDAEPHLHDHPVSFLSLILRGGYYEERIRWIDAATLGYVGDENVSGYRKRWNYIRASTADRHRITEVSPNTLTLCFMGPKKRDWGFHTPEGWVYWRDYNKDKYGSTP